MITLECSRSAREHDIIELFTITNHYVYMCSNSVNAIRPADLSELQIKIATPSCCTQTNLCGFRKKHLKIPFWVHAVSFMLHVLKRKLHRYRYN